MAAAQEKRLGIQEACDDVFCNPDDVMASRRLRQLLGEPPITDGGGLLDGSVVSRASWRRLVKIACDELHDDPEDVDAKDRLLLLLAVGDGGPTPAVVA